MNQGGFPSGALGAGDIRNRIIPHHPDLGREIGHFLPQPKDLWVRFVYANLAGDDTSRKELTKLIGQVEKQMRAAAADLNFEQAAELRDKMIELKKSLDEMDE